MNLQALNPKPMNLQALNPKPMNLQALELEPLERSLGTYTAAWGPKA